MSSHHGRSLCFLMAVASVSAWAEAPIEPFRTAGGRLGFLLPGTNSPAGLRVLIDEAGTPGGWSEWGFDRMAEGASVYRYPPGEQTWKWENEGSVVFAAHANQAAMVLPNVEARGTFRWMAERYDDQWRVVHRQPVQGILTNQGTALPPAPPWLDPPLPDMSELLQFSPTSLSRRLQQDYVDGAWSAVSPLPAWPLLTLPGQPEPAHLVLAWTDVHSGKTVQLEAQLAESDGQHTRWRGTTPDGDAWFLVVDSATESAVEVTAWVQAKRDRCFRLSLGAQFPEGAWTWFEDMYFAEPLEPGRRYTLDGPSPYGLNQRRAYYPFGVIASEQAVLVAETDGREPRHLQIEAQADARTLWIHYDLATTPGTRHFPGLAAVRARFRTEPRSAVQPFRAALQSWYDRDPDWWISRTPQHGLWLPFTDIASISNPADFGFMYFEKVGPLGSDVEAARAHGVLTLVYTEPWLYWLPLANTSDWNRAATLHRMETLARTAVGKEREFASGGRLGVTRDADQQPRIQFLATPWSTGARMEVVTDPELLVTSNAPVNRAMAEWRFIKESLDDPRVDGIYLDSMSAMETLDYNPASIAVADYPCTFVLADLKPGLATPIQAVEFTATLAGYLRSRDKYLMGNFPCWRFPFFMPYLDIPGEETTWYTGKQYTPLSERERNYRRAMSGAKPFGFLQATHFSDLSSADMEKYFRDCLALGLLPSFFSHDGANDPYWVDAKLYERDRPLFRRYLPLTIRLSAAGWQPVPAVSFSAPQVQVEQFGSLASNVVWITLRNTGVRQVAGTVQPRAGVADRVAYAMGTGHVYPSIAGLPELELEPGEVAVWALLKPEALTQEADWFRSLASHHPHYRAGAVNLFSNARERELGLVADVYAGAVTSRGEPVGVTLALERTGELPLQFLPWQSATSAEAMELARAHRVTVEAPSGHEARAGLWTRLTWEIQANGRTHDLARMMLPPARPGVVLDGPDGRFNVTGDVAELVFAASNRSSRVQLVALQVWCEGSPERLEWKLAPGEQTQQVVRVTAEGARMRRVTARWEIGGRTDREHEVFAIFAPPLQHLAMQAGVRVTADSAYSGYTTAPLHDGIVETVGLIWHEAAFASAETAEAHWIRVHFALPQIVSSVTAHWTAEGDTLYASRRAEIWGLLPDGRTTKLGGFDTASTGALTCVSFTPTLVRGMEWRQPASGGSAARPDLLWMVELEMQ